jgi:hypothetical protein
MQADVRRMMSSRRSSDDPIFVAIERHRNPKTDGLKQKLEAANDLRAVAGRLGRQRAGARMQI